ncbi:hypothetical protein ACI2LJ_30850 [Streptomyces sp. NPDC088090]|uniref:hypothetical protein n=1 Tax=Streptomyces sp. NPDC088090 TaxID=3365822 RepID=UPI00384C3342
MHDLSAPLPLATSPEYHLRLARKGALGRALLIAERYQPADRTVPRYLTVLYGAAVLDTLGLEPEPDAVEQVLITEDQAALDEIDRLYRPLDRAALLLTEALPEEHIEPLRSYGARVAASPRLARNPLHSGALHNVPELLEDRPTLYGYPGLGE